MWRVLNRMASVALVGMFAFSTWAADMATTPAIHGDLVVPIKRVTPAPKSDSGTTNNQSSSNMVALMTKSYPKGVDYSMVGFDRLASYNFQVDEAPFTNQPAADKANDQIPAPVKSLNQQKVTIKGFMLPLKVSEGAVTEFLIMKDQSMCCYGTVPKITEWVSVKMNGHGVKSIMDQPVSVEGTLRVGAMRENGYLIGIYQMDGEKLIADN